LKHTFISQQKTRVAGKTTSCQCGEGVNMCNIIISVQGKKTCSQYQGDIAAQNKTLGAIIHKIDC